MALPILEKTWIHDVNNTINSGGPFVGYGALMFAWKTFMTTGLGAWSVVSSSDGVSNAGAADYWLNATDANVHGNGVNHSWIVLQNDAISTGFQICVDLRKNGGGASTIMEVYVSEAAGFTGGTLTARPTATDEVHTADQAGRHNWTDAIDLTVNPAQLHMQRSDDGTVTHWWIYVQGYCPCFYVIEKPQDAVPDWSIPWIAVACVDWYASTNFRPTYGYLNDIKTNVACRAKGSKTQFYLSSEGAISSMIGQLMSFGGDLDGGAYPFFPIGIWCDEAGARGRLGRFSDLWWGSVAAADGDHYPGDATRQFAQVGDFIVPWPGGAAMLIT